MVIDLKVTVYLYNDGCGAEPNLNLGHIEPAGMLGRVMKITR